MLAALLALVMVNSFSCMDGSYRVCLPSDLKASEVIEVVTQLGPGGPEKKAFTVGDRLKRHKARCRKGKLVDASGRPIVFYRLKGCWGTPPENYQEIIEKQTAEIEKLRKDNVVIEIPCNPDPLLPPAGRRPDGTGSFDQTSF